jgi:hypothetical protein
MGWGEIEYAEEIEGSYIKMPNKNAWLACGMILLLSAVSCEVAAFFFDPAMLAYAEEGQKATIEDAKQEASQEAAKAGDHTQNLKQSVKKDTTAAAKTVKSGAKSGFSILKKGIKSLSRGEGVKVEKSAREEQNPYDP